MTGNISIRNGAFSGVCTCSCCDHISTVMCDGEATSSSPAVCRPQRIDSRGERRLLRIVLRDRRTRTVEITTSYNSGDPNSVSQLTVRRTLSRVGLCSRRPNHVAALTVHDRKLHLQWAKNHRNSIFK